MDELEKAFAGVGRTGGGSDVTTRLFGYFLTWLQEKQSTIFVVATANEIVGLPAEFFRRGRFDELFAVSFPNNEERRQIFDIHLKKRGRWHPDIDNVALLKETKDFSGADIEGVVKLAVENAFLRREKQITTADLLTVIRQTKSLKETMKEKIAGLEAEMAKYEFKPASSPAGNGQALNRAPHWSVPRQGSVGPAAHDCRPLLLDVSQAIGQVAATQEVVGPDSRWISSGKRR